MRPQAPVGRGRGAAEIATSVTERDHAFLCERRHQWDEDAEPLKSASGVAARAMLGADGRAPRAGQLQRNPDLAATFRAVAQHGALEGAGPRARHGIPIIRPIVVNLVWAPWINDDRGRRSACLHARMCRMFVEQACMCLAVHVPPAGPNHFPDTPRKGAPAVQGTGALWSLKTKKQHWRSARHVRLSARRRR